MARPNKILEPLKTYNLTMKIEQYERLAKVSREESEIHNQQVSVADLMREAIDIYLNALEEEDGK